MPRAKTYPGTPAYNDRWGGRRMHWVAEYQKYGLSLGIYSDSLDQIIKLLVKRIRNHEQNVLHISGGTGAGKSTLAIIMAQRLAEAQGVTFDLDHDYIYGADDLWQKLKRPDASPISLFDEASVSINSQNFRGSEDRDIGLMLDTMRSRSWTTFFVSPQLSQINKSVRCIHVDFVCECASPKTPLWNGYKKYERGFFEFKEKIPSNRKSDPEPYWNLLTTGTFPMLDAETDRKYQKIKAERQQRLIEARIKKYNKDEGGVNDSQI